MLAVCGHSDHPISETVLKSIHDSKLNTKKSERKLISNVGSERLTLKKIRSASKDMQISKVKEEPKPTELQETKPKYPFKIKTESQRGLSLENQKSAALAPESISMNDDQAHQIRKLQGSGSTPECRKYSLEE